MSLLWFRESFYLLNWDRNITVFFWHFYSQILITQYFYCSSNKNLAIVLFNSAWWKYINITIMYKYFYNLIFFTFQQQFKIYLNDPKNGIFV